MNFLPLRLRMAAPRTGRELLAETRKIVLEAQSHQDCPFEKIVEVINPERKRDQNPLYNVALLFQNFPPELFKAAQVESAPYAVALRAPLLDLRFEAEIDGGGARDHVRIQGRLSLMMELSRRSTTRCAQCSNNCAPNDASLQPQRCPRHCWRNPTRRVIVLHARISASRRIHGRTDRGTLRSGSGNSCPVGIDSRPTTRCSCNWWIRKASRTIVVAERVLLRIQDWRRAMLDHDDNMSRMDETLQRSANEFRADEECSARLAVPSLVAFCRPLRGAVGSGFATALKN